VHSCIPDKARLYSLVVFTAGYMYQLKREPTKRQQAAFYLQSALAAMRAQIKTNDLNEESFYTIIPVTDWRWPQEKAVSHKVDLDTMDEFNNQVDHGRATSTSRQLPHIQRCGFEG